VSWSLSSFAVGVVQVRASQGRRGRNTGSYVDRGARREVRAWAARTVKRLGLRGTRTSLRVLDTHANSVPPGICRGRRCAMPGVLLAGTWESAAGVYL
jgi:hypothetical protein